MSQVGTANGVAALNGSGLVPSAQLGSGSASSNTFLRGDGSWQAPSYTTVLQPSGDTTGAKDAAAINAAVTALGSDGGTVFLAPGSWYLEPGGVSPIELANSQTVVIDGQWGAVINAVSGTAGDVLRMYNPNSHSGGYSDNGFSLRSGVRGVIIDGTNATAGSTGLHIGDMMSPQIDVIVQNFSGTGDIGLHLDNSITWTEEGDIRAGLINNASNVVFEVTVGWQSFAYGKYDFSIQAWPGQDGVYLKNGAYLYNGSLRIRGNFGGSNSPITNAALRLQGTAPSGSPSAGDTSAMWAMHLDIQAECNGATIYTPQTVYIGNHCFIESCQGIMGFLAAPGTWTACNVSVATAGFEFAGFNGFISGDANLNPGGDTGSSWTAGGPVVFNQAASPVYSGIAYPVSSSGDFFKITLAGDTQIALNYSGGDQYGAQRKTFLLTQAASGGPYTVTWPKNGSPSPGNPTVLWAGGTVPTMSTAAGATDMYELSTIDGLTWIGHATQNVS